MPLFATSLSHRILIFPGQSDENNMNIDVRHLASCQSLAEPIEGAQKRLDLDG